MNPYIRAWAAALGLTAMAVLTQAATMPVQGGVLNLSCVDALVAVGQPNLAGVFAFVPEKDSAAAFADLMAREPKALKKYMRKLDDDIKVAGGITPWDHEAILAVIALLGSPLAETFPKPPAKLSARLNEISMAQTVSLETVTARRKKS
jgi:hypothetical protein